MSIDQHMKSEQGDLFLWYTDDPGTSTGSSIVYRNPYIIYLGHVNKISESFSKTTSTTPLITMGAVNAFPLDGGTGRSYSFNGTREQPITPVNGALSTRTDYPPSRLYGNLPASGNATAWNNILNVELQWSCSFWIEQMQRFIDRWQMKTDGCFVLFRPASTNPYVRLGPRHSNPFYDGMIHGYLKSIEFTYNSEYNEQISYYMTVSVGTCRQSPYVNELIGTPFAPNEKILAEDSCISMTSVNEGTTASTCGLKKSYVLGSLAGSIEYTVGGETRVAEIESAIKSYKITGGPNQPFETITMTLPKMKLRKIMPSGFSTNPQRYLIEGQNKITVDAVGTKRTFILSSVKSASGRTGNVKLQGRVEAYRFKTKSNQSDTITGYPFGVIQSILYSGKYGPSYGNKTFKYLINKEFDPSDPGFTQDKAKVLTFKEGRSVWDILQICAITIRARLFFIGDYAYLIDFTIPFPDSQGGAPPSYASFSKNNSNDTAPNFDLFRYTVGNATMSSAGTSKAAIWVYPDLAPGDPYPFLYGRLTDDCKYEQQGSDTVTQTVTVNCLTPDMEETEGVYVQYDERATAKYTDENARNWNAKYGTPGEEYGVIFDIDDLLEGRGMNGVDYHQGRDFAESYIKYMLEPQQPVTFEVKETAFLYEDDEDPDTYQGIGWQATFPYVAQAESFLDDSDDLGYITNESIYPNINPQAPPSTQVTYPKVPQKLCLSLYEHNYPEMTTTYTWGMLNGVDLTGRLADRF